MVAAGRIIVELVLATVFKRIIVMDIILKGSTTPVIAVERTTMRNCSLRIVSMTETVECSVMITTVMAELTVYIELRPSILNIDRVWIVEPMLATLVLVITYLLVALIMTHSTETRLLEEEATLVRAVRTDVEAEELITLAKRMAETVRGIERVTSLT